MDKDCISLIVCIYNMEQYLDKCILSIVNQTYQNLEILLIDDGSTDSSASICDNWAANDKRIKVIHQKNQGISMARNTGLKNSTCDLLCFVDSDDFIDAYFIENLYHNMRLFDVDISICDFKNFENESELTHIMNKRKKSIGRVMSQLEAIRFLNNEKCDRMIVSWNKLFKKKCFQNIEYPEGKIFEDSFVIHYLLNNVEKVYYDYGIYYYRYLRKDSIIHEKFSIKKMQILESLLDRCFYYENKLSLQDFSLFVARYLDNVIICYFKSLRYLHNSNVYMDQLKNEFNLYYKKYIVSIKKLSVKKRIKYFLFSHSTVVYTTCMKKRMR